MMARFALLAALALGAPAAASAAPARSAAIEVGPKWVVGVVVEADPANPAAGVRVVAAKAAVSTLGLLDGGKFRPELVSAAADDVAALAARFRDADKVPAGGVRVFAAAALAAVPNRAELEAAIRAKADLPLGYLTAADELRLARDGLALQGARAGGLLVCVGDADVKAGAAGGGEPVAVGFGTVTLTAAARDAAGDTFAAKVAAVRASAVAPALAAALRDKTPLKGAAPVALTGGAAGALVALVKPAAVGRPTVEVTPADVAALKALVAATPGRFPAVRLDGLSEPAARKAAEAEIARVRDAYSAENLAAAAELLDAVFAAFALDKGATFVRAGDVAVPLAAATPEAVRAAAARGDEPKKDEPKKDGARTPEPKPRDPKVSPTPPTVVPTPVPPPAPHPGVPGPVYVAPHGAVGPCACLTPAVQYGNPRAGLFGRLRGRR